MVVEPIPGVNRLKVRDPSCTEKSVLISLLPDRREIPAGVLGLAYRRGKRIEPRLEVFLKPLLEFTVARGWTTVGVAMARVAAHELAHYLKQTSGHRRQGLLRAGFTPRELTDRGYSLRLPRVRGRVY